MEIWISLKLNCFIQTRKLKYKKLNCLIQTKYLQNERNLNQGNQNAMNLNFLEIFKFSIQTHSKAYADTLKVWQHCKVHEYYRPRVISLNTMNNNDTTMSQIDSWAWSKQHKYNRKTNAQHICMIYQHKYNRKTNALHICMIYQNL